MNVTSCVITCKRHRWRFVKKDVASASGLFQTVGQGRNSELSPSHDLLNTMQTLPLTFAPRSGLSPIYPLGGKRPRRTGPVRLVSEQVVRRAQKRRISGLAQHQITALRNEDWRRQHDDGVPDPATGRIVKRSLALIARLYRVDKATVLYGVRTARALREALNRESD
jgi:hypothetical protein